MSVLSLQCIKFIFLLKNLNTYHIQKWMIHGKWYSLNIMMTFENDTWGMIQGRWLNNQPRILVLERRGVGKSSPVVGDGITSLKAQQLVMICQDAVLEISGCTVQLDFLECTYFFGLAARRQDVISRRPKYVGNFFPNSNHLIEMKLMTYFTLEFPRYCIFFRNSLDLSFCFDSAYLVM